MASRSEPLLEQELPAVAELARLVDETEALRGRRAAEFVSTYRRAARDVSRLSAEGARLVVARIDELRVEITDRIRALRVAGPEAPFALRIAPEIEAQVQVALTTLIEGASADVVEILSQSFAAGAAVLPEALSAAGLGVSIGTGISPALLTTLQAASADLITEVFSGLGDRIARTVRQSIAGLDSSSATIEKVAELLRTSREVRVGLRRRIGLGFQAEAITRTEVGRAFSAAQQAAAESAGEIIPGLKKRWITRAKIRSGHLAVEAETRENPIPVKQRFRVTDDSRTGSSSFFTGRTGAGVQFVYRTASRPRQGVPRTDRMLFPRDPSAGPGNVVNCLLPDNEIAGEFEAGLKARYTGPVYEIETAGGARLTLTVNHPVPTEQGWIGAQEIQEGDRLFKNAIQGRLPLHRIRKHDDEERPATAQQVFDSLRSQGTMRTVRVTSLDFDGDGRFMMGDIEIVRTDRILLENLETTIGEMAREPVLMGSTMSESRMPGSRLLRPFGQRASSSPDCLPCRAQLPFDGTPTRRFNLRPFQPLRFGDPAPFDTFFAQQPENWRSRDPDLFADVARSFAGQIALDDVVRVREYDFSGHVYDFKSTSGMIRIQDIFVGNCTCMVIEIPPGLEDSIEEEVRRADLGEA